MSCVVLQHDVFHFIISICLLHLTFAAETAVFLVACLAFLASFAALLIHRKRGSYPCLPLTVFWFQHWKSFPRSGMECITAGFSSIFTMPWGNFYRDNRTVTEVQRERRHSSLLPLSLAKITQYYIQIQIKSKQKTPQKSYKTQSSPRVFYEKYCNL